MSFYKQIEPFVDYIHSIRKLKDYLSFDLKFPTKWGMPKEDNQTVPFESDDVNLKGISFVSKLDEKEITSTIAKILKIIKVNKERELKEQLFKHTIDQLKKTFEQNDLDKLQNLYFDFASEHEDTSNLDVYDTGQSEDIELAGEGEE